MLSLARRARGRRLLASIPTVVALTLALAAPARAQTTGELAPAPSTTPATAPVVIDGVTLFDVRGATSYPAEQRAAEIVARIVAVGRDRSIDLATVRVEPGEFGPQVVAGDGSTVIVTALDSDARRDALSQRELAELYRIRIRSAASTYRELRDPSTLLRSAAWSIGATALLVGLLLGVRWGFRRLDGAVGARIEAGVERLRIQSFRLLSPAQTWRLLRALLRGVRTAVILVLVYAYLNSTLGLFPWTRGIALDMLDLVIGPLEAMVRATVDAIPGLVFLAVLAFVTRTVIRMIRVLFGEIQRGAVVFQSFDPDWAMPTYRLVRLVILAFALVVAFPYIPGSQTGAFKGVSLFVGVLFSLGSSSVIGNIIAGYTMTYRRAFRDGDRIRVGDVLGDVTQTRLLVTHVRTPKNENVVIPNSLILSTDVINYSTHARTHGLILHTNVGIGYEVPWRQVEAMLSMAAERTDGLLREPPPFVLQTALGDFAVTYELNAYCDDPQRAPRLYAALHRNILDVFNEFGVQIMTPAYEGDTPEPKLVARDRWFDAPAKPSERTD